MFKFLPLLLSLVFSASARRRSDVGSNYNGSNYNPNSISDAANRVQERMRLRPGTQRSPNVTSSSSSGSDDNSSDNESGVNVRNDVPVLPQQAIAQPFYYQSPDGQIGAMVLVAKRMTMLLRFMYLFTFRFSGRSFDKLLKFIAVYLLQMTPANPFIHLHQEGRTDENENIRCMSRFFFSIARVRCLWNFGKLSASVGNFLLLVAVLPSMLKYHAHMVEWHGWRELGSYWIFSKLIILDEVYVRFLQQTTP